LADGNENTVTVTGGAVTLPHGRTASRWTLGLPYRSRGRTLRAPQQQDGSLIGRKAKAQQIIFDLLESSSLLVSSGSFSQEITQRRKTNAVIGDPIPLFTGTVKLPIEASWDSGGVVDFECSHARPVTIRAITPGYEAEP
jgi:hypothetical protein